MARIVLDPEEDYTAEQLEIYRVLEPIYGELDQLHHSRQEWNQAETSKRINALDVRIARLEALRDAANNIENRVRFQEGIDTLVARKANWESQEWQDKIADYGPQIASLNQRKDDLEVMFENAG